MDVACGQRRVEQMWPSQSPSMAPPFGSYANIWCTWTICNMIDWKKRQTNHWGECECVGSQFCLYFSLLCIDFISRVWSKKHSTAVCLKYLQENCKQRTTSGQCPGGWGVGGVKEKKGCGILWEEKTISLFCSIFVVGLCFKRSYWKSNNDVHWKLMQLNFILWGTQKRNRINIRKI